MTFSWSLGPRRLAVLEADHNAYNEVRGNIREIVSERVRSGLFEVCISEKGEMTYTLYLLSSYSFRGILL